MRQVIISVNRRRKLIIAAIVLGSMGMVPVFVFGGYQAIQAVDSSAFCTNVCHTVHYAEAVTHAVSVHSEVACAQCHVGEGTKNLILSKIKGATELIPTLTNSFTKPIPTPLKNPPTTETCETCHSNFTFSGDKPLIKTTYAADANNTKSQFTLVLKVDGGLPQVASGIHWHATAKVWYIAADSQLNQIIWVGVENSTTGKINEYVDPNRVGDLTPQLIEAAKKQLNCIDCHNRVSHLIQSPGDLIDAALNDGSIEQTLPYIKRQGLDALSTQNQSLEQVDAKIQAISDYYKTSYPDVYSNKSEAISRAIAKLQDIAKQTIFNDGLDWNTYVNNAVHNQPDANNQVDWNTIAAGDTSGGCFRCHGNLMKVDSTGQSAESLTAANIPQFIDRVNATVASLPSQDKPVSTAVKISNITSNATDTGNLTPSVTGNVASSVPAGAYKDHGLVAECNTCHYSRPVGTSITPLAPAIPHPTNGLDNCLVCHAPGSARPFNSTHPWATNQACKSCHESAPELQTISTATPPAEAPLIPHPLANMSNCLSCHGTNAVKAIAITANHPWAPNGTCTACHKSVIEPLPAPQAQPVVPKAIPHSTTGLENCLSCHGQATIMPFKTTHPWASNDTCNVCHQPVANPQPLPQIKAVVAKEIPHATTGLENCLSCHGQPTVIPFTTPHPWGTNQACAICHKPVPNPQPFAPVTAIKPVLIPHVTNGLENCLQCHGQPTILPYKTAHPWSNIDACVICHKLSPGTGPATPASLTPAPAVPHSITGLPGCTACHQTNGLAAFPANHAGRPDSFCSICHTQGSSNSTSAAQLVTGPAIPHPLIGLPGCTSCHHTDGPAPFPVDHAGRPETFCRLCHTAAAVVATPSTLVVGPVIPHPLAGLPGCTACHQPNGAAPFPDSHAGRPDNFCPICHQSGAAIVVPAGPTNLAAVAASAGRVNLTWVDNANTETGFRIERSTDSGFAGNLIKTGIAANISAYADTTTFGNTTYYYRIFAVNSAGDSAVSDTVSVATPVSNVTMPAAPGGLSAFPAGATQVDLTWVDNANTESGFRIDRATNSGFTANLISVNVGPNTMSYSDATVSGNTTYYYRIVAFNSGGNSGASNPVMITTPVPVIDPAALYASNCDSCHGVNLEGGTGPALTIAAMSNRTLAQITAKLTTGTMSSYTGTFNAAQIATLAQWLKGNPPAAASGLAALAASAGQVNLTWTDNAADETGFCIERATNNGFSNNLISVNVTAGSTTYSDTTVSGNTTYYYRIFAFNPSGDATASNTASVTTPASLTPSPAAPSGMAALAVSATQVNLTWVDNANTETGFRIDRATTNAFTTNLTSVNVAANTIAYSDTTVSGNTTYYYRVMAFNAGGNSAVSSTATVTTPAPVIDPAALYASNCDSCHGVNRQGGINGEPSLTAAALSGRTLAQITAKLTIGTMSSYTGTFNGAQIVVLAQWLKGSPALAPASLTATAANAGQVYLTWTDPNSGNETGFQVDRATDASFILNLINYNVGAGVVSYNDTTTAGNTTYYYRVFAVNSTGNSAASNTANATTPASSVPAPAAPSGLTATGINGGQVNLTWVSNSVTQTGFRVDRALDSAFTNSLVSVNTGNTTSYSDNSVSASTLYYYRVYAFNAGGLSPTSNTASVTTPAMSSAQVFANNCAGCHGSGGLGGSAPAIAGASTPTTTYVVQGGGPTMPSFTTTQISATQLTALASYVAGLAPAPTTGAGLFSLNCAVCHGDTGLGTTKAPSLAGVPAATMTPLAVSGLSPIMPAYPATAISSTSMSTLAAYIAAMGPPPSDGWGVYAEWCARCHGVYGTSPNIVGSNSISSVVRSGTGSMPGFTTTQISAPALTNLQTYVAGGLFPPDTPPPTAPTGLTATAIGSTSVSLSWTDPNNGVGETGMRLQRATSSSFSGATSINLAAGATSYVDSNLTAGTTYYYRVQARATTSSAYSNTATVTPAGGTTQNPPPAPGNLNAVAFNATLVNLTWVDNGNETGFLLQRANNNSFTSSLTTVSLAVNTVSYSDNNVTGNATYYYRVLAYNSAGNSTASSIVSVTTPALPGQVPVAASNLTAVAVSNARVNLTWLDNSGTESGFRIQRSTNSSFTSNLVTFTVGQNMTTYSDTSVSGGITYYYRIIVYNANGNGTASNTRTVTTPS